MERSGSDETAVQAWTKCLFPCKLSKISLQIDKISLQCDNISQHFLCISLFISLQITKFPGKEIPDLPFFYRPAAVLETHDECMFHSVHIPMGNGYLMTNYGDK